MPDATCEELLLKNIVVTLTAALSTPTVAPHLGASSRCPNRSEPSKPPCKSWVPFLVPPQCLSKMLSTFIYSLPPSMGGPHGVLYDEGSSLPSGSPLHSGPLRASHGLSRLACAEAQAYSENRHSTDQYDHLMAALAAAHQEAQAYLKAQAEWLRGQGSNPGPRG